MVRNVMTITVLTISLSILFSCASTPPAQETEVTLEKLETAKTSALDAQKKADTIKSSVSAHAEYDEGTAKLQEAETLKSEGSYIESLQAYEQSEKAFLQAHEIAEEKRNAALKAIEQAEQAIAEAEKNAAEARDLATENGGN